MQESLVIQLAAHTAAFNRGMAEAAATSEKVSKGLDRVAVSSTKVAAASKAADVNLKQMGAGLRMATEKAGSLGTAILALTGLTTRTAAKFDKDVRRSVENLSGAYNGLATEIGRSLSPALNDMARAIDGVANAWRGLDPETQQAIAKWTLVAAQVGVATFALSKVVQMGAGVATAIKGIGLAMTGATAPVLAMAAGVLLLVDALSKLSNLTKSETDFDRATMEAQWNMGRSAHLKDLLEAAEIRLKERERTASNKLYPKEGRASARADAAEAREAIRFLKSELSKSFADQRRLNAEQQRMAGKIGDAFDRGLVSDFLDDLSSGIENLLKGKPFRPSPLDTSGLDALGRTPRERLLYAIGVEGREDNGAGELTGQQRLLRSIGLAGTRPDEENAADIGRGVDDLARQLKQSGGLGSYREPTREDALRDAARQEALMRQQSQTDALGSMFLGEMGSAGKVIMGGMAAGPMGVIAALMTMSAGWEELIIEMDEVIQIVADAVGGLAKAAIPLVKALSPLAQIIANAISPMLEAIGKRLEAISPVITFLGRALGTVVIAVSAALSALWNGVLSLVAKFLDLIGAAEQATAVRATMDYTDYGKMMAGVFHDSASQLDDGTKDKVKGGGSDSSTWSEQLTNVPSGFKTALAQYAAQDATAIDPSAGLQTAPPPIVEVEVYVGGEEVAATVVQRINTRQFQATGDRLRIPFF